MQEAAELILLRGGLDAAGQLTKTSPLPPWLIDSSSAAPVPGRPWWHVYLDNFAGGAKVAGFTPGALETMQETAEGLWDQAGIVISKDKTVTGATSGIELGAFIGGKGQWIGAGLSRSLSARCGWRVSPMCPRRSYR